VEKLGSDIIRNGSAVCGHQRQRRENSRKGDSLPFAVLAPALSLARSIHRSVTSYGFRRSTRRRWAPSRTAGSASPPTTASRSPPSRRRPLHLPPSAPSSCSSPPSTPLRQPRRLLASPAPPPPQPPPLPPLRVPSPPCLPQTPSRSATVAASRRTRAPSTGLSASSVHFASAPRGLNPHPRGSLRRPGLSASSSTSSSSIASPSPRHPSLMLRGRWRQRLSR
jgi:hypothetical protein